ncbi:MAG: hypothetical protein ACT4O4_08950 [Nitrospiraceae bacterium]
MKRPAPSMRCTTCSARIFNARWHRPIPLCFWNSDAFVALPTWQDAIEAMTAPSTQDESSRTEPPLWSIGLAVAIILGAPLVLYSLAPTGPLREGDTAFSDGQQRAQLATPAADLRLQPGDTCLLDPNSPLIVLRVPNEQPDGLIAAQVQGSPASEWPFCPLHAEVWLKAHQMFQKPAVLSAVREMLARWFGR